MCLCRRRIMEMEIILSSWSQFYCTRNLQYKEEMVAIFDHDIQNLKTKEIKSMKVQ